MKHTILDLRIGSKHFSYDLPQYSTGPESDPYSALGLKNRELIKDACSTINDVCKKNNVAFTVKLGNQYIKDSL